MKIIRLFLKRILGVKKADEKVLLLHEESRNECNKTVEKIQNLNKALISNTVAFKIYRASGYNG